MFILFEGMSYFFGGNRYANPSGSTFYFNIGFSLFAWIISGVILNFWIEKRKEAKESGINRP